MIYIYNILNVWKSFRRKNQIKLISKLNFNNATDTKTDRRISVIVTCCEECKKKIDEFVNSKTEYWHFR
jgi:hypothetical protein